MIDIRSFFNHLLLPQDCLLCGDQGAGLPICEACQVDLPWHSPNACPSCALPTLSGETCGTCLKAPPAFDRTRTLMDYEFPVDALLRRFKYAGFLAVADLMGSLMANRYSGESRPDLLIPMPLHPSRLKERGFNQAVEIGRILAKNLHIPMDPHACRRVRPTTPQAGLTLQARQKNLRGAFTCSPDLSGKHVALIDDVMTTGASLDELARAVRKAGAIRVECWVIARTLKH